MGRVLGRQRLALLIFLVPPAGYVILWRILPAVYTIYLSFTSYNLAYDNGPAWRGMGNYLQLVRDDRFLNSLLVTLQFSVSATLVELVLGLSIAILLDRSLPARNLILALCLMPMVLAPVAVATIWYVLFHNFVGPIPYLIQLVGGPQILWLSTKGTALLTIVVADIWEWTPLMMLLLLAALQGVPRETVEAAMVDGASGVQVLRFVTLPQIASMIAVAVGLRFMDAFLELDKVMIMTGGGPGASTETVSMHIYRTAFQFFTLGYAAAIVLTVLLGLVFVYRFYLKGILTPDVATRQTTAGR